MPIVSARDGHDFIADAIDRGASAYLTAHQALPGDTPAIEVDDTAEALMVLAQWARARFDIPVIGVTGSVGKTTTKDLIAAAVGARRKLTANERSFNNEQGLPVTILGAPDDTEALIVEMGMRGFGEIARLCEVARPTVGVVTAVAASHTGRVGGIDGVATAKVELVQALPANGVAILNGDDPRVFAMGLEAPGDVLTFGTNGDVSVSQVQLDRLARPRFRLDTPWGRADVALRVSGVHMVSNAAAAVAVAGVLDGKIDDAVDALLDARVSGMRMDVKIAATGGVVVDDAYNANPDSMAAALKALAAIQASRRVAVVGGMGELDDPVAGHRSVAALAEQLGIELIAVGTDLYGIDPVDDPVAHRGPVRFGEAILVKASRSAGLDRWVEPLLGEPDQS